MLTRIVTDSHTQKVFLVSLPGADLCNPTLPHSMSVRIAESLGEEFEGQAAKERELGHPVSVMLAPSALKKAEMEIGFITFVVCLPVSSFSLLRALLRNPP